MTERDKERGEGPDPLDEEAAWAEIVAGYGERPKPPPGVWHPDAVPDRKEAAERGQGAEPTTAAEAEAEPAMPEAAAGGVNDALGPWSGTGPRDWAPEDEDDEGHFVPPEPPPLPVGDMTTRLAWAAVLGGPLLLLLSALLGWDMTWWIATAGIGGFLGGFATLVSRLRDGRDDEWTDPGSGAVV